jgi:hypothetical protein
VWQVGGFGNAVAIKSSCDYDWQSEGILKECREEKAADAACIQCLSPSSLVSGREMYKAGETK